MKGYNFEFAISAEVSAGIVRDMVRPFFEAYNAVMEEIDATGVLVSFSW